MRVQGNPLLFRKVTIIGIGLLGGSIGMAIKKQRLAREVVGVSRRQATLSYALRNKIVDKVTSDITKSLENADLVILATPVKTIVTLLANIGKHLKRGCIVMDVGSTKSTIVEVAHKHLPAHVSFVGAHPLAGSEKKGVEFSSAQLFDGSFCVLTSTEKTNKQAEEKIKSLWTHVGSKIKVVSPSEHDKILAYTSHVPHLLAYGMIEAIPEKYLEYGSTGLKDTTRIAGSNPQLWSDISMENSKNILNVLDEVVKTLSVYRQAVASRNESVLTEKFKSSKSKRDAI
ncbi:MAG: prephenate dehydrogenase/arogenate dehydrogenase family protein [Candidatus Aceula meridiana]|nr:prephenate dehydrogenase/arogenate dehydrogenase family protein [Candidatus Aceula meridiana]